MIIQALAFYLFAAVAVASGVMVIGARNPVHSVLFLILAFFNSAGLFVLLGAEFLAMILVVVYVGAVAVLFLFVVMMLDINFVALRAGFLRYMPIGALIGLILLAELVLVFGAWVISPESVQVALHPMPVTPEVTNARALGRILYTDYFYLFQTAGLILLVAMIGAILMAKKGIMGPETPKAVQAVESK
jgi:NADH-quinone oxidoreductase subunit J